MDFELGMSYDLPVKEVITENKRVFYKVEADGKEYNILLFDFQKEDEKPEKIACVVKELRNGEPLFVQDIQPLLLRLYKVNVVYPLWVKADYTYMPHPYYEISDWHHFTFKLPSLGIEKLKLRQRIECRVKKIVSGKVYFELIKKEARTSSLPFLDLEGLLGHVVTDRRMVALLCRAFRNERFLKDCRELYESGNEEWIITTLDLLAGNMDQWVTARRSGKRHLLEIFRNVCIYILEDSDILLSCSETERSRYQRMISEAAQQADIFLEAQDMVARKVHAEQTDRLLAKMKRSGYLYDPDRRLKVLMCLFSLDRNLMASRMQQIFDIILHGNKDNWMREPFRSAFIGMLDLYVRRNRRNIDCIATITTDEEKQEFRNLIVALAILLLLMNEKDDMDRQLIRAMFYRYLTYVNGSTIEVLFEKAFRCLTEVEQSKLEFNWNDVSELTMLAIKTSSTLPPDQSQATFMQSYDTKFAKLQIYEGKMELHATDCRGRQVPVLPEGLLPWHHIQIYLQEGSTRIGEHEELLTDYQKFWKEIEYALLNGVESAGPAVRNMKMKPEVGDEVMIRIKHQDLDDPRHFVFIIEDPVYCGEGRLSLKNIVRYNLIVDEKAFRDNENRPYLLRAKVLRVDPDGYMDFTLTDLVLDYVREELISIDGETVCVVTDINFGNCLCVSEYGYTVQIPMTPEMEDLKPGSYIRVQICNMRSTGIIEGAYLFTTVGDFTVKDVFEDLIMNYADEQVYEPATIEKNDETQQEVMMDREYVAELIHIIDRKAVLDTDYITTYNYLALARLLTLLLQDDDRAVYYNERMRLIQMLQYFVINGCVEVPKMEELAENYGMMIQNYPILQNKLHELQLMACMDAPEHNDKVWKLMSEAQEDTLKRLCRLVLSYNALKGFGLYREREAIRKKINEVLNIQVGDEHVAYFGEESQTVEFKTSTVYPPNNNMRPDLIRQTDEILEKVCGFLNAEGGQLYLGVNNEGVACGLENDLSYLGGKDKFDLHIRNMIVYKLGVNANSRVRSHFQESKDKLVYILDILPSQIPVELNGICYQRQGTSTWPLLGDNLELFRQQRMEEVERILAQREVLPDTQAAYPEQEDVPEELPAVPEADAEKKETIDVKKNVMPIATSVWRDNPLHSWEDGYGVDLLCFLHFLPDGEYMVSDEEIWEDVDLSLCIREGEEYVVIAYEQGGVIKVPVSQITDKARGMRYKRLQEKVFFACPAKASDLFYSETRGLKGKQYMRLDGLDTLKEGSMTDAGARLVTMATEGFVRCDILEAEHRTSLSKIYNLKATQQGNLVDNPWCREESDYIVRLLGHAPEK